MIRYPMPRNKVRCVLVFGEKEIVLICFHFFCCWIVCWRFDMCITLYALYNDSIIIMQKGYGYSLIIRTFKDMFDDSVLIVGIYFVITISFKKRQNNI